MAKYIKKPVAIEAIQWDGSNRMEIDSFTEGKSIFDYGENFSTYDLFIETLEGTHKARIGDMIIKGIKGEFYPCKPDIFKKTYYTEQEYAGLKGE